MKKNLRLYILLGIYSTAISACGTNLDEIRDNLFKEKKSGRLYFKASKDDYRDKFSSSELETEESKIALSDVVQEQSWKRLSVLYYMDENKVYYHNSFAFSGTLHIVNEISSNKLHFYTSEGWKPALTLAADTEKTQWYVSNLKNIFYKGSILPGGDVQSFKVMDKIDGFSNGAIAVDKNGFYDLGKRMKNTEVLETIKSFKVSNEEKKQKFAKALEGLMEYYKSLQLNKAGGKSGKSE